MHSYDRYFGYDKSTNLLNIASSGVQNRSQRQMVDSGSNRLENAHYDLAGNQLETVNLESILYNHQGQVTSVQRSVGATKIVEYYTYATEGNRIKKVTETTDQSGSITKIDITTYVGEVEYHCSFSGAYLQYDRGPVVEDGQPVIPEKNTIETRIKLGHSQIAKIIQDQKLLPPKGGNSQSSRTDSYTYNLINHIDSNAVRLDREGSFLNHEGYYPYGGVASSSGNPKNKQLGYSGQELDSTNLNYFGFRYYDSFIGRWMRPDPLGMQGSGLNRYAMVGGNPVSQRDHLGLMSPFSIVLQNMYQTSMNTATDPLYSRIEEIIHAFYGNRGWIGPRVFSQLLELRKIMNQAEKVFVHGFGNQLYDIKVSPRSTYLGKLVRVYNNEFYKEIRTEYKASTLEYKSTLLTAQESLRFRLICSLGGGFCTEAAVIVGYFFQQHLIHNKENSKLFSLEAHYLRLLNPVDHRLAIVGTARDINSLRENIIARKSVGNQLTNRIFAVDLWPKHTMPLILSNYFLREKETTYSLNDCIQNGYPVIIEKIPDLVNPPYYHGFLSKHLVERAKKELRADSFKQDRLGAELIQNNPNMIRSVFYGSYPLLEYHRRDSKQSKGKIFMEYRKVKE